MIEIVLVIAHVEFLQFFEKFEPFFGPRFPKMLKFPEVNKILVNVFLRFFKNCLTFP